MTMNKLKKIIHEIDEFITNKEKVDAIKSGQSELDVELSFKDHSKLTTTDSLIYLGQTYNSIFFLDLKTKESFKYPQSEVKSMKISKKPTSPGTSSH